MSKPTKQEILKKHLVFNQVDPHQLDLNSRVLNAMDEWGQQQVGLKDSEGNNIIYKDGVIQSVDDKACWNEVGRMFHGSVSFEMYEPLCKALSNKFNISFK